MTHHSTLPSSTVVNNHPPALTGRGRFAIFLVGATLFLILLGALVKSHEAGLSVPDWPASYGHNMFLFPYSQWIGGIFYEHAHRLVASGVGLLTVILAVWSTFVERNKTIKLLCYGAVGMVILQGLFGGLTVMLKLPDLVSVFHGVLAQTFLLLLILITSKLTRNASATSKIRRAPILGICVICSLYLQLILGALMRHAEAGLAIPDFPTMGGSFIPWATTEMLDAANLIRKTLKLPPVTNWQLSLHLLHRIWSVVVFATVVVFSLESARKAHGKYTTENFFKYSNSAFLLSLITLQFTLGVVTVITVRNPWMASLHVFFGAVLLASCFWEILRQQNS
jgi:cytochrome c oxidase assembly protein subunit 15